MANASQPGKWKRPSGNPSYCDSVPNSNDYARVVAREERLVRVNNNLVPGVPATAEDYQQDTPSTWAETTSWAPKDNTDYALDPDGDLYDYAVEANPMEDLPPPAVSQLKEKEKKQKSERSVSHKFTSESILLTRSAQRRPNIAWKDIHRQTYLDKMLHWEGRGEFSLQNSCPDCLTRKVPAPGLAEHRCLECFMPDLVCAACCVKRHKRHPFHRIQV